MSQCKKFSPNIFHKTKCSNCFRQKEEHSAEALECNRFTLSGIYNPNGSFSYGREIVNIHKLHPDRRLMDYEMDSLSSEKENNEDFFKEMEIATKVTIPIELKNMLKFNGLLSDGLLSRMTDSDLESMEEFARNHLHKLIRENDFENYYGVFKQNPSNFKFLIGHRKTFHLIVDFFKRKVAEESKRDSITLRKIHLYI
ncbi:unnamed protein product [Callosobruchus maculatus]|uniref:Uncharacterized protein n=1 Tax=Callosobruchus maculatus TaxID=64391 RepID=A0A653DBJ6_CALMS|nr:unnamed protein product [Callosobruchus maculatus]